jgi:hypothetical protein
MAMQIPLRIEELPVQWNPSLHLTLASYKYWQVMEVEVAA